MGPKLLTFYRILLSLVGIFLAFGYHRTFYEDEDRARRWAYTAVLLVCTAFAFYLYLSLGPRFRRVTPEQIMNPHDFFHYYVGPKYHAELGYFDIYECAVLADHETTRTVAPLWRIRDLHTYNYDRASRVLERAARCKQSFTPARWEAFKHDVAYISRLMTPNRWNLVLKDKGYNATPVWNAFASLLTNLVPLRNRAGLYTLLGLDYLWTVIAFVAIAVAFGWRHSLLGLAFWSLNFVSTPGFVRGSLSRLDWLVCLIVAVCLLRRGRYAGAGALAGLATTLRVFPVLFCAALGARGVWSLLRERRLPRRYLRFLVGFAVVVVLLCGATALTPTARERWGDFGEKITGHDEQIAGYRVGFKYMLIDPKLQGDRAREMYDSRQGLRWTVIVLVGALVFLAARHLPDHHTIGLSFVCVFFLTAPTFYYYQMLVLPFMLFLPDRRRPGLWVGAGAFFAWCVLCYTLRQMWPLGSTLSHYLSWSLAAMCALLVIASFVQFRGDDPPAVAAARS
jgi:hypothetical protein